MKKVFLFAGIMFLSTAVMVSCGGKDEKKDDKKEEKKDDAEGEEDAEEVEESSSTGGGATNWSQAAYDAYMNSCVESAKASFGEEKATAYCACTADKMQQEFPDETKLGEVGADKIQEVFKRDG